MNAPSVKCRVCWEVKEAKVCVKLSTKWTKESSKTIKDIVLLCVPWMSIKDDSYLCRPCLWQLKFTYDFIERCLKTENILNEENNIRPLNLEEILENSLNTGDKIQIIIENPVSSPTDCTEDTEVINLDESIQESDDDVGPINFKIHTLDATIPSEHDYCIKKGTQMDVSLNNSQQKNMDANNMTDSVLCDNRQEQNFSEGSNESVNNHEKENIFTINENTKDNDSTTECTTVKNNLDPRDTDILRNSLTTKKKLRRSKMILPTPDVPLVKHEKELKELLDIAAVDISFITAHVEMSAEQQDELVRDGINVINMTEDVNKKKRIIYLSRDLYKGIYHCLKCKIEFASRCDYMDHDHLHRRGKIKTPGPPIHTCKVCSETFTLDIEFRNHTRALHGISSPHQCMTCNKRFKTLKMLKDHNELFKDYDTCSFRCKRCRKVFSSVAALIHHELDVEDAPCCNYKKCQVCFEKFTKEDFKIHCKEVHSNYLCYICGKSFANNPALAAHQNNVHKAVNCMCHECGRILSHPRCLEHHIQNVHGEKKYMCDKCPRQFTCQTYLKKHMKTHLEKTKNSNTGKKWFCDKCGKSYVKKETLRQHKEMFHLGVIKFSCPICHEGFTRKDYLARHIKYHEEHSKNTCSVCKKSFGSEWRLEFHMFTGHDENGKPLDSGIVKRPAGLKKKPKGVPSKVVCKICKKVLACKTNLMIHYKAHLNLRRNKCHICGIIFQGNLSLSNHIKLHKDPKFQFSCNICHAYKSSNIELKNHMLEVHKNKKYKCNLCSEVFGRKHLLNSHETIVHKDETYKKEVLFEMLQKNVIRLPADADNCGINSRKGVKLGDLKVDVDQVFNTLVNKKNEAVPGGSQITTLIGGSRKNVVGNQTPSPIPTEKHVLVLGNEYRIIEDARACKILEEENRKSDLFVNYRD